jgi:hypothetical protein
VEVDLTGDWNAATGTKKPRVWIDEFRREEPVEQQTLGSGVDVAKDEVEKSRSLDESRLENPPFGGSDGNWNEVQFPGAITPLGITVHVVGDAVFPDNPKALIPSGGQLGRPVAAESVEKGRPVGTWNSRTTEALVERTWRTSRRTGRSGGGDRA